MALRWIGLWGVGLRTAARVCVGAVVVCGAATGLAAGAAVEGRAWPRDEVGTGLADDLAAVGRTELARAYMRFDHAFAGMGASGEARAAMSRRFDRVTLGFFGGRFGDSVGQLAAMTCDALGLEGSAREDRLLAESVRIDAAASGDGFEIGLRSMFVPEVGGDPRAMRLEARAVGESDGGRVVWGVEVVVEPGRVAAMEIAGPRATELAAGTYAIGLSGAGGFVEGARLTACEPSLRARGEALGARLDRAAAGDAVMDAVEVCRSRIDVLLGGHEGPTSLAFLGDLARLADEVEGEVAAIEAGRDPYAGRRGDWWGVVPCAGAGVPMRVVAPAGAGQGAALVIALHGAGGDEHMFVDAYGGGALRRLAEERGFIAVSPSTLSMVGGPEVLDGLVDRMAAWYEIDRERGYVIGHSMGGGMALGLARARADRLAGVVGLAPGGGLSADRQGRLAPVLVIGAALDAIIPESRVRAGAMGAIERGLPVEYEVAEEDGHTLVVGLWLERAVDWLQARRLDVGATTRP